LGRYSLLFMVNGKEAQMQDVIKLSDDVRIFSIDHFFSKKFSHRRFYDDDWYHVWYHEMGFTKSRYELRRPTFMELLWKKLIQ